MGASTHIAVLAGGFSGEADGDSVAEATSKQRDLCAAACSSRGWTRCLDSKGCIGLQIGLKCFGRFLIAA